MGNNSLQPKNKKLAVQYTQFLIATAILLFVSKFPLPESVLTAGNVILNDKGRMSLGILFFCLYLWITEPIPFHITGCIGILLMAFCKLDSFGNIVKIGFGSDTIIFFIGVLTLSAFITLSGLGKRISMFILSVTGNKTSSVLMGFMIAGTVISMWITDMAVAAMLMPIARSMLEDEGLKPKESNFGKALMITCAWGALIGGIGTPAGCGPNQIAIGFMKSMLGINVSFLQWMTYGVPAAFLMIVPSWWLLLKMFKPEITHLSKTKEDLKREFQQMGPMTKNEIATTVIFAITVTLWLTSSLLEKIIGFDISTTIPALICACLFFLPGATTFKWKQISDDISWDGIILIATGISLGMVMYSTGAAEWLSVILLGGIVSLHPVIQIFLIVMIVSIIKVGLSSNTVTATIIMPIMVVLAQSNNMPLMGILLPTALSLSLAFILVTSTPTSVIPYSAGYFSIPDMAKAGAIMTVIASVVVALTVFGLGLVTGLY